MKKTMMTLAAILTLGLASAQVDPVQPQQPEPNTSKDVIAEPKRDVDATIDVPIDPNTIEENNHNVVNDGGGLKNELKTDNHVKSTPQPVKVEKAEAKRKLKAKRTNRKQ
jgi:hypothetical protein